MAAESRQRLMLGAALAGLALVPVISTWIGEPYYVTLFTRVVILALAAVGLNLILGYGALIVGVVDTIGRAFLPTLLREFLERSLAQAAGPAIASMLIYILMAVVLAIRPQGLFPVKHG